MSSKRLQPSTIARARVAFAECYAPHANLETWLAAEKAIVEVLAAVETEGPDSAEEKSFLAMLVSVQILLASDGYGVGLCPLVCCPVCEAMISETQLSAQLGSHSVCRGCNGEQWLSRHTLT